MADENTAAAPEAPASPGLDWEQQAKQFQAELDRVNPLLDVATARVGELTAKLELAETERNRLGQQVEAQAAEIARLKEAAAAQLAAHSEHLAETQGQLAKANTERSQLRNSNTKLSTLCQQQRDGLAKALKVAGDFVAAIHAALGVE